MARLGRRGEAAPNACLTNAQAEAARRQFDAGEASVASLARQYGCSYWTMWRVVHRITYRPPDRFSLRRP
jgi:hypothetical protein